MRPISRSDKTPTHHSPNWTLFCILGYVVCIPWATLFVDDLNAHDASRVAQIILITACGITALLSWVRSSRPISRQQTVVTCLLAVLTILSVAKAADPRWAMREVALFCGLAATAWVVAACAGPREWTHIAWAVLASTCLYQSMELLLAVIGMINDIAPSPQRMGLGYVNHRLYNHVQTIALPSVALAPCLLPGQRGANRIMWLSLTTGFALLVFSGARATTMALMVGSTAALLLSRQQAWPVVRRLLIGAGLGWAIFLFLFVLLPQALALPGGDGLGQRLHVIPGDDARLYLWRLAWQSIQGDPWLGIGPMQLAHLPNLKGSHPHNFYLQLAAEWGVLWALTVFGLAVHKLWRVARIIRSGDQRPANQALAGAWLTCFAMGVDALLSGNLVMPVSQSWAALVFGLMLSLAKCLSMSSPLPMPEPKSGARVFQALKGSAAFVLVLGLCSVHLQVLQQVPDLRAWLDKSAALSNSPRLAPRYWSSGWF